MIVVLLLQYLQNITETELETKGYLTEHQDITGKADKTYVDTELAKKANVSHNHSYNDLTDKPTIPSVDNLATKEELTNGLATKANVSHTHDQYLTEHQDLSDYALKTDIPTVPTKTSQLTNDSGFITSVPSEYITETELDAKGYLTSHQDISNLALKSEIPDVSSFITSEDLPTVPTKVSELTNDSNFITSIPEEYITETELKSNYYTKEEVGELLEEGGSGVYSTTTPVNNPIGGIKRGDKFTNKPISEIIDLMLHVVERVKVALSSSVSGGIREIGDTSISTSTFKINVTKGTNPVVSVKLFKDNVEVQDFADVENGGSFTYDGGAITTDTKFVAKANDGDGDIASTAISYKFVSPMYIGSSDNGLEAFSETDATSLTKKIVDKNTKTIQAFTHTQQHMCFVVPNTWNGSPTIKDQNNFDITTAFNSKAIQVTGLDGVARDYIAFVSNDKSTLSDYSITITF